MTDVTWREIAIAYPEHVQLYIQKFGGTPEGTVTQEDWDHFVKALNNLEYSEEKKSEPTVSNSSTYPTASINIETIEVLHDYKRMQWGIPNGKGEYVMITQELLELSNLNMVAKLLWMDYGINVPMNVLEVMSKNPKHEMNKVRFALPSTTVYGYE